VAICPRNKWQTNKYRNQAVAYRFHYQRVTNYL
jgi:hypothetical protein